MLKRRILLVLVGGMLVWGGGALAAPEWVPDPENSKWVAFGEGERGIAATQGLYLRADSDEGRLVAAERGGTAVGMAVREGGAVGYFYVLADPWEQFRVWQGEHDLLLTLRLWEGGQGRLMISYDSSDPRVKRPPYQDGVWRRPEEYPEGIPLGGGGVFRTVSLRLPLAQFTKRCHGADFRLDPLTADFALLGIAITRVPREAARVVVTQNLRVESAEGFESFGPGARFAGRFAQWGDEPIVMEAEHATRMTLRDGRTPGTDPQASGGGYIHYVASASWEFTVETPGRYIVWKRGFFPWPGGWNHTESMDDGPGVNIVDGMRTPEEGWQWIRGGEYDLEAGEHVFHTAYEGGARLDVIVLSREDTPPDLALLESSYVGPVAGVVQTAPVRPFDVAEWAEARLEVAGQPAAVVYEYSTDGGRSWTAFDPATGLGELATVGGGEDLLQFRLQAEGRHGRPPLFAGGAVDYVAGPNNVRHVENERLRLAIDPYGVQSLFDKRRGKYVSRAPEPHDALALLVVKPPGDAGPTSVDLYSGSLEEFAVTGTAEEPVLTLVHRLANGMTLTSTARLFADGQIEWQLHILNPTDLEVAEVRFPVITGIALDENPEEDWFFLGKCWGQVWQHPAASGRLQTFWGPSMRWTSLWQDDLGLYLGIEDPRFDDWAFVYGGDASGGMTLAPQQRILCRPRSTWQSGVYRLAVTGGGWHEGADLYRAYVAEALQPPEVAPHIRWLLDEWSGPASNHNPFLGWEVITTDGPYFWAANRQMTDGADSGYCGLYPYPALTWGSVREFSQKLALRRATGGMYTPYHNTRLWSPGYGHYPRIGTFPKSRLPEDAPTPDDDWWAQVATYSYGGNYERVERDPFAQVGTAMAAREWQDWLLYWTDRYLDWGTDGMYYDQFNMIYPNGRLYPDFDTYGNWAPATLELISRMKQQAQAKNPYYTFSGEACNDVYGQYVDLHMTSGVWNRLDFYSYCNPQQILIDGAWNGGLHERFGGLERRRFIWQCGARFENWTDPDLLALRRAVKSLLYAAEFRDTVGLVVRDAEGRILRPEESFDGAWQNGPCRGVIGRWFRFEAEGQSGAIVNLINYPVQVGATVALSTREFGPVTSAVAWTLEGETIVLEGTQRGDRYTFPVPESECSSVVLAGRLRPLVEWDLDDPAMTAGVTRELTLRITNPNAEPMSGTARLQAPRGWRAPGAARFGPLAAGESTEVKLQFTAPANAPLGRHDVWCEVTGSGRTFRAYSFVVMNEPLLVDFRGNPGSYHVWVRNLGPRPLTGTVELEAAAPLLPFAAQEFTVAAESEAEIPVRLEGRIRLREVAEMLARVRLGGRTYEVVRGVMPVIPNGDFETDSAGDMKPDWWMCRKVRDEWSYERMSLSPEARSGERALRLEAPREGEEFIRAYPNNGSWTPATKYRVSVWIRSEAAAGVYAEIAGRRLGEGQTGPEWRQFSFEFTTAADVHTGGWVSCSLINRSEHPACFDDLLIEEIE